jgi:hypothetical protein
MKGNQLKKVSTELSLGDDASRSAEGSAHQLQVMREEIRVLAWKANCLAADIAA